MARYRRGRPGRPIGLLIAGLIVALFGGGWTVFSLTQSARLGGLQDHGQNIPAEAIATAHRETRRSKGGTTHHYYVTVRFKMPGGEPIQDDKEVESSVYSHYVGASSAFPKPTNVLFDPLDKTNWIIAESLGDAQQDANISLWIGLGVAALGGVLMFAAVMQAKHRGGMFAYPAGYQNPMGYMPQGYAQPYPQPQYPQQPYPGAAQGYPQQPYQQYPQTPYQPQPQAPYRPPQPPR